MKTSKKIRFILIVVVPLLFCVSLINYSDTDDPRIEKIIRQFNTFRVNYKQQKIYLHTDKDTYMAGETMWIKAYLIDASLFRPDSISKDIYVELLNSDNKSVSSMILKSQKGFAIGDIALRDTLLEGNYQLRAFTNWMRNFDNDYLFYKTITIKNPNYENIITNGRLKNIKQENRILKRIEKRYRVTFFPEGGNMVAGLPIRVAFKAETGLGMGVSIKGILYDNKHNEVVSFQSVHDGLGSFEFTPKPGLKYHAIISYENGKSEKFSLPSSLTKGFVMSVNPFGKENITVTIQTNRPVSENIASNEVIIVAQSRGIINYVSKGEIKDKPVASIIPKKILPSGIIQITLFDGRGEPVCERLVFIDPKSETGMNNLVLTSGVSGDSVLYKIKLSKADGSPALGNLSMSVTEDLANPSTSNENILTNLLLTSDLKGRINNPSYYFDKNNPEAFKQIDLVMLTHGWRRFVWKDILANKFPVIRYPMVGGLSISGRITRDFFEIPISGSKVVLSLLSTYNDKFETKTDSKGRFEFPLTDYEDTIDVKIEAFKPSGGKGVQIILGDTLTPEIAFKPYPFLFTEVYDKKKLKANTRRERANFKKNFKEKPEDENTLGKIHDTPNDVIHVGQDVDAYSNILQYMQGKVPGVNITGNRVIIRGINTLYGSTDPLFLMDGVPIDASAVPSINPSDISTIEILKGPEAAIYGSRGANGVIAFYSKRGHFMKRGVIEFGMLGYHKTREFYVPAYDTWKYQPANYSVPRTVYWKPFISIDSTGTATVRFKKKFPVQKMNITLEGITDSGEVIHYESQN